MTKTTFRSRLKIIINEIRRKKSWTTAFAKMPDCFKGTTQYHSLYFASADVSFETIAALRNFVNGTVAEKKIQVGLKI